MRIGLLIRWLILTIAIIITAYLIDGIRITGFFSALFAAAILGLLNAFFRPVLLILTLPINILSLGLFTFIINAMLLMMVSGLIPGFNVYGFWSAVFGRYLSAWSAGCSHHLSINAGRWITSTCVEWTMTGGSKAPLPSTAYFSY